MLHPMTNALVHLFALIGQYRSHQFRYDVVDLQANQKSFVPEREQWWNVKLFLRGQKS
jgi:hypothetical protein